ncbi:MAG: hypothetical protein WCI17_11130, partial [bacterium]
TFCGWLSSQFKCSYGLPRQAAAEKSGGKPPHAKLFRGYLLSSNRPRVHRLAELSVGILSIIDR